MTQLQLWRRLPKSHKNDDHYKKHCVNCGEKVIEWDREWVPPDRPNRGHIIFRKFGCEIKGAQFCLGCANQIVDLITKNFNLPH